MTGTGSLHPLRHRLATKAQTVVTNADVSCI